MNEKLPGDSGDYHLIERGVELSASCHGFTCELGVRRGGGTGVIMDAIKKYCPGKIHIAVDPYGNIEYEHKQSQIVRLDYTNEMRNECMENLFAHAKQTKGDVLFFNLEDTEFFKRFDDGVPTYNHVKTICNKYSFVHFDAAHALEPLWNEIEFFMTRIEKGACFVFDDVNGYYNHDLIDSTLISMGFVLIQKTYHKALYQYDGV